MKTNIKNKNYNIIQLVQERTNTSNPEPLKSKDKTPLHPNKSTN